MTLSHIYLSRNKELGHDTPGAARFLIRRPVGGHSRERLHSPEINQLDKENDEVKLITEDGTDYKFKASDFSEKFKVVGVDEGTKLIEVEVAEDDDSDSLSKNSQI